MIIKIPTLSIKGDWILGSIVIQVYFIFLFFLWYLWRIQVYGKEAIWKSAEAYCFKIYGRVLRNTASADRRIKCQVRGKGINFFRQFIQLCCGDAKFSEVCLVKIWEEVLSLSLMPDTPRMQFWFFDWRRVLTEFDF